MGNLDAPSPAIDTPSGHAEAAFQSTAIAFREVVLYQHDMHVLTINKRIEDLRLPKDAGRLVMVQEGERRLAEMAPGLMARLRSRRCMVAIIGIGGRSLIVGERRRRRL